MHPQPLVIDTHWALDLWAFDDPRAANLRAAIASGDVVWLACAAMRAELARVLTYPRIAAFLARRAVVTGRMPERAAQQTLAAFDRHTRLPVDPPALAAGPRCRDPDDQIFIDLAVAHRAILLSRDRAVLALTRTLRQHNVRVQTQWPTAAG
jgi:predicted nucleic acid-binding protein